MAFLVQFFRVVLSSFSLYILLFFIFSASYLISKPLIYRKKYWFWIYSVLGIGISFINAQLIVNNIGDLLVITCCVLMVLLCDTRKETFNSCIKIIFIFSVFYASSIWIQILLPGVYKGYLNLLSSDAAAKIIRNVSFGYYTGFSTNCGFTAGHIVAGIFALTSKLPNEYKERKKNTACVIFLLVSLFMTGKRFHAFACLLVVVVIYLFSVQGSKKIRRIGMVFTALFMVIILFYILKPLFMTIPSISRIIETLDLVIEGADVSNGRLVLWNWGMTQFRNNPIFGIGWGQFRNSVIGNVTLMTELDSHNIYVQLLCETGLVGFVSFVIPMLISLVKAIKLYKQYVTRNTVNDDKWKEMVLFSISYQAFFILYGFFGNPLYDTNYQIIYFFVIAVSCAAETQCVYYEH